MDYCRFLFIIQDHHDNTCMGNNLIVECKFNMGLESVVHTTVWRMLSGTTPAPLPPYSSFQHMAVNRWITWSQFTCCLKGVNELMTQVPQNINRWITCHPYIKYMNMEI